ncbi:hypothetical protein AB0D04_19525 [Streptomyces sp. NPDC048483]|uniref:hypothetical protein n=1 Tax=Streptomyces sp. NPDC048483 TaxID=3154927 RepID=UPI00343DAC4F
MRLDDLFPNWDFRECHRLRVAASCEATMRAVEEVTWSEVPVFRMLMFTRSFGKSLPTGEKRIIDSFRTGAYSEIARTDDELVVGSIIRTTEDNSSTEPYVVASGEEFATFDKPGYTKIAYNFHWADGRLNTETRVVSTDRSAHRKFTLYWAAIRLPSGFIRHEWLRAIRRKAEMN